VPCSRAPASASRWNRKTPFVTSPTSVVTRQQRSNALSGLVLARDLSRATHSHVRGLVLDPLTLLDGRLLFVSETAREPAIHPRTVRT
jgi:hypothetical protein